MSQPKPIAIGKRVRINEEPSEVPWATYAGKMAIVKGLDVSDTGAPMCMLKIDRVTELARLPEAYLETLEPQPSSLLANHLFLPWDMNDPKPRLDAFLQDNWLAGHILEVMMFYDQIIVPTVDFAIIVPLVHWLGPPILKEMLESGALSFVRFRGGLAYDGRPNRGLHTFEIHPAPEKPEEAFWIHAARCPAAEAVTLQLQHRLSGLPEQWIEAFSWLVEICTVETSLPEFTEKVEEETYRDILGSQVLADRFGINISDPQNLSGLDSNQMRIFASLMEPASTGDAINITLGIGMLNLEAYFAEEARARDMETDREFSHLLTAKVRRYTGGQTAHDGFFGITNLENIPEVAGAIASGAVDVSKAWEFWGSKSSRNFREWFDKVGLDNPHEFQREYVRSLRDGGIWSGIRAKAIRFCVVQGASFALVPVLGPAAVIASIGLSVVDSFLLETFELDGNLVIS